MWAWEKFSMYISLLKSLWNLAIKNNISSFQPGKRKHLFIPLEQQIISHQIIFFYGMRFLYFQCHAKGSRSNTKGVLAIQNSVNTFEKLIFLSSHPPSGCLY